MKVSCPQCRKRIPPAQLNVATDVALCEACGEAYAISDLLGTGHADDGDFDIHDPPRGAWFEDTGVGWRIGATTRSPVAFFLVPFMCVWSGGSLGGIYGSQIAKGELSLGLSLFGIPFLLGTLLFGTIALMTVCGQVVVSTDRDEGRIFTGIGPFGWRRRFDWRSITSIEEDYVRHRHPGNSGPAIALIGQSRMKFGSMLNDARRYYIVRALRLQLASRPRY